MRPSRRRVPQEFQQINEGAEPWVKAQLVDDNVFKWRAQIIGPVRLFLSLSVLLAFSLLPRFHKGRASVRVCV